MSVFLPYAIENHEMALGISYYLNVLKITNTMVAIDGDMLTVHALKTELLRGIERNSHVMALITRDSVGHWWPPFALEHAALAHKRVTAYVADQTPPPAYAASWPLMRNNRELDQFIELYKRDAHGADACGARAFQQQLAQLLSQPAPAPKRPAAPPKAGALPRGAAAIALR